MKKRNLSEREEIILNRLCEKKNVVDLESIKKRRKIKQEYFYIINLFIFIFFAENLTK